MIKSLGLLLLLALIILPRIDIATAEEDGKNASITLKTTNTVVLSDQVSYKSISKVIFDIENSKDQELYLFLSSPGGSVSAGELLLTHLKSTDKKVTCVADFAASMAFVILQGCESRVILPHGVIMQHQVSYGLRSQPAANQASLIALSNRKSDILDTMQSKRIGMPKKDFQKAYHDDLWLYGADAVEFGAADSVGTVICSKALMKKTVDKEVRSFFGTAKAKFSACPLLPMPVSIESGNFYNTKTTPADIIKRINQREI